MFETLQSEKENNWEKAKPVPSFADLLEALPEENREEFKRLKHFAGSLANGQEANPGKFTPEEAAALHQYKELIEKAMENIEDRDKAMMV